MNAFLRTRRSGQTLSPFITKAHIIKGMQRAAFDIWQGDASKLPSSTETYRMGINSHEPISRGGMRVLYPSPHRILYFFGSINEAWYAAGFLVETVIKQKSSQFITPEVDEKLCEIYRYGKKGGRMSADVPTVKAYAKLLGVGPHLLTQRATKLGLVTPKEKPWSKDELKLLERYAHLSPVVIQRRFKEHGFIRTEVAINLMRKRRRVHKGSPYYSMRALATLFGYEVHKITREWLVKFRKELPFEKKGTARRKDSGQHGDVRLIHVNTIREFVYNHPEEVDLHKVDKLWFLWLITKGRIPLVASSRVGKRTESYQPQLVREHRVTRSMTKIVGRNSSEGNHKADEAKKATARI